MLLATVRDGVLLAARASGNAAPSICVAYSGGLDSSVLLHVLADVEQFRLECLTPCECEQLAR